MFELNIPKIKKSKIKVLSLRRKAFLTKKGVARITNIMNKPIREPISIKLRKKVLERAKGKCEKCRKIKNSDVRLNFHHKNMINDDNRLSNIRALCPNCHAKVHKENKVIYIKDLTGRRISSIVVGTKTVKKRKNQKDQLGIPLDLKGIPN